MFENVKEHYNEDVNAIYHVVLGSIGGLIFMLLGFLKEPVMAFVGLLSGGLFVGIGIEVYQLVSRTIANRKWSFNLQESRLDALTTATWFMFITEMRGKYISTLKEIVRHAKGRITNKN